jgi:hypothetical protein
MRHGVDNLSTVDNGDILKAATERGIGTDVDNLKRARDRLFGTTELTRAKEQIEAVRAQIKREHAVVNQIVKELVSQVEAVLEKNPDKPMFIDARLERAKRMKATKKIERLEIELFKNKNG